MSLQSILYQFLYSVDFQSLLDSPTTFPPLAWQTVVICFNILRPLLKTWKIFTPPNQSAIFLHGNDTKMNKINKIEYIKKMIEEITTKLDAKWHTSCYVMQPFLPSSNFCSVLYSVKNKYLILSGRTNDLLNVMDVETGMLEVGSLVIKVDGALTIPYGNFRNTRNLLSEFLF